jgi:hypothetical protein
MVYSALTSCFTKPALPNTGGTEHFRGASIVIDWFFPTAYDAGSKSEIASQLII